MTTNYMVANKLVINDDKTHMDDDKTKSMAQVNINLDNVHLKKQRVYMDIGRHVNANASPDVPKPLYQWGLRPH